MNSNNHLTPSKLSSNQPRITVRCAIYTRKSTDEGLEQEFNSLDAQRESAEAYIASQFHEGWICLPENYDDGGFTGGNMERPALKRLMDDIEAGKVDCVVVYKVDRLSRSLLDFARIMEVFQRQNVSFVSVTQQFNTATSMGRLILNVLLSFAQFEREIISERTRDKIAAARRKGKWSGGMPVLGYDVVDSKLVVNEDEAVRVREIFRLYLEIGSLIPTIRELDRRGWRTKRLVTRKGKTRGGRAFNKNSLYNLLTNVTYVGTIRHKGEIFQGEHQAIIETKLFKQVGATLRRNYRAGGLEVRNQHGALLRGMLFCRACNCSMTHTFTSKGNKRYRYYVCLGAQKRGRDTCPSQSLPAAEIERFVVDQIRTIGRDSTLVAETLRQARQQSEGRISELKTDLLRLVRQLKRDHGEVRKLVPKQGEVAATRMADLHERIRSLEQRETEIRDEIARLERQLVDERDLENAMGCFDPVWDSLSSREQIHILNLLIQRISFDGEHGDVEITFHPHGIKTLAEELKRNEAEVV